MASVAAQRIIQAADQRVPFFTLPADSKGRNELRQICKEVGINIDSMIKKNRESSSGNGKKPKPRLTQGQVMHIAQKLRQKRS